MHLRLFYAIKIYLLTLCSSGRKIFSAHWTRIRTISYTE